MFHYRYAKHKSNYLRVTIPAGADYIRKGENGGADVLLQQGECTLVLPLFGGNHTAVARFAAGTFGAEQLMGETVVPYAYEQGKLQVCDYDYLHHGLWAKQHNDTPPYFRLLRSGQVNGLTLEEPLLTVSSSKHVQAVGAALDQQEELTAAAAVIQNRLRTIYDRILEAVEGTGILLSIHNEDIIEEDDAGNIVGAAFVQTIPGYTGYFYNVDGSSEDDRPPSKSWLDFYDRYVANPAIVPPAVVPAGQQHRYCASQDYGRFFKCTSPRVKIPYIGGHILQSRGLKRLPKNKVGDKCSWRVSGLFKDDHRIPKNPIYVAGQPYFDQNFSYYMLPICQQHNNTSHFDVVMYTKLHGTETLLELNCFRSDYTG